MKLNAAKLGLSSTSETRNAETTMSAGEAGTLLASAMRDILGEPPCSAATVSDLARVLGIGRGICQRVVLGTRALDGNEALLRFPGLQGLDMFLQAARRAGAPERLLRVAETGMAAYRQVLTSAGGSQARLVKVLAKPSETADQQPMTSGPLLLSGREARRQCVFGMAGVTGLLCSTRVEVQIIRVLPEDPAKIESVQAGGLIGLEARADALPCIRTLVVRTNLDTAPPTDKPTTQLNASVDLDPAVPIPQFSTESVVQLVANKTREGRVFQVINTGGRQVGPVDLVTGNYYSPAGPHPMVGPEPRYISVARIPSTPSCALLMDIYLERSLAMQCVPSVVALRLSGGKRLVEMSPDEQWPHLLPNDEALLHLGSPETLRRPPQSYPRANELAAFLFKQANWPPETFIGYRLELEFPLPDVEYTVTFEFGP